MGFLINLVRSVGRLLGRARDLLARALLALIYLLGVGLMALFRPGRSAGGWQPAAQPDLSRNGLERMG